jgi:hypothetical protein
MTILREYYDCLWAAYQRAEQFSWGGQHSLMVGDRCIELRIGGTTLSLAIWPALAHLQSIKPDVIPDIIFGLWDTVSTGVIPPPPPFTAADYRRYGQRAIQDDGRIALMHAPTAGMLFAYDRVARLGLFWTTDAEKLSIYERAAPLQTLLHWALNETGWHIVHAGAVGTDQGGVLLLGNSGAGKSTLALSSLDHAELRYLCDDKCLVRLEPTPEAFGVFNAGKLKADMLDRFPDFQPLIAGWDNEYKAGKSLAFLHPTYAEHMIKTFPIKALLIPRIAHQAQPTLTPATAAQAFRVLGPSTVIWMPGAEAESFRCLARLVSQVPCYFIDLAENPWENNEAIHAMLQP